MVCKTCNGKKKQSCGQCAGTKKRRRMAGEPAVELVETCTHCDKDGNVTCPICRGTGVQPTEPIIIFGG